MPLTICGVAVEVHPNLVSRLQAGLQAHRHIELAPYVPQRLFRTGARNVDAVVGEGFWCRLFLSISVAGSASGRSRTADAVIGKLDSLRTGVRAVGVMDHAVLIRPRVGLGEHSAGGK